ncbi:hypothetical protein [Ulvibacter antarcticus]|uniref:Heme-binding HmuY-like protein n=1 Tax=Ulvibacter antarcticus TaxID=442714 RepID=A0A3L9YTI9_9FLAO|nr:hypothetical protein [Ulvibacter antarcticus]RMA57802.1 hypothetical protein BXY75_2608 [Ulvibacter antarcticus]
MKKLIFILCIALSTIACNNNNHKADTKGSREFIPDHDANPNLTTAQQIAYANGVTHWKNVSEINFTFNVDRGENHFERSWNWKPKTNDVMMRSTSDTIRYNRSQMDSIIKKTDAAFINDKYWLLAPYNLVWDQGTEFSEKKNMVSPISKDTLDLLTITYGNEGGYTPGDAYDLYFGKDYRIKEWVFREGNDSIPSMTTTWEDYENFNGIEIAKMHKDSTGNFKLYFTNISVKLTP